MKFTVHGGILTALQSSTVYAGFDKMYRDYSQLALRYPSLQNGHHRGNHSWDRPMDRSVVKILEPNFSNINLFGCWCYFDADYVKGKGNPMNDVDALCKHLHDGYECAIYDGELGGYECSEPWTSDYNNGIQNGISELVHECTKRNANMCDQNACIVEGHFVLTIIQIFMDYNAHVPEFLHSNGFEPKNECHSNGGFGAGGGGVLGEEMECCGEHPDRHPYRVNDGLRDCCGGRTYSTAVFECCDPLTSEVGITCN